MTPMTISITTELNAIHTADAICDECPAPAPFFIDALDDEFCASYCRAHAIEFFATSIIDLDRAE